jgi:nitrogen fixation-related uncharacterized protein
MAATTSDSAPERTLQSAQLEQLQLTNEKLKLDIANLKKAKPWYDSLIGMLPLVSALVAVAGFLWGVMQYRDQQAENNRAQLADSKSKTETAEREFMKPWLEAQRETYASALSAAATVANSDEPIERKRAEDSFWRLYHGKMILVETKTVSDAMAAFGTYLQGRIVSQRDRETMNTNCRALASAMADSMGATSKMTFQEFAKNKFKYKSDSASTLD